MIRVALYTLGCKLNQVESEGIADAFRRMGFQPVSPAEEAELYVVNTCTVTSKAEQKARRMIRKFSSRDSGPVVLVTGCYAQLEGDLLDKLADRLILLPLDRKASLVDLPEYLSGRMEEGMSLPEAIRLFLHDKQSREGLSPFAYEPDQFTFHARAFLKIEDGCDNRCSYCRVRIARGPAVSLDADIVLSRAAALEARGYQEIVLTGVNISAYRWQDIGLAELVHRLDRVLQHTRIRLSSIEPDMLTNDMISAIALPRVQPHLHLPIQTGSDDLVKLIGRSYRAEEVLHSIERIRSLKGDLFLAADMITGLPGEDESRFEETLSLVNRGDFSHIHVFPYSPRPGTELYGAPNPVAEYLRDQRAARLRVLSREGYLRYLQRQEGRSFWAVAEQQLQLADGPCWSLLTENYIHCRTLGDQHLTKGEALTVTLETSGESAVAVIEHRHRS